MPQNLNDLTLQKEIFGYTASLSCSQLREASHIDFVHEKRHMDVGGWGGEGVGACFSVKIMENFDSMFENFYILKSSIQSIQNPAFCKCIYISSIFVC